MRASTLGNNVLAINREIDSRYDAVIAVRDKLPEIELVAGMDLDALITELENAQDFTGITVVSGTEVAWDAVNKVLTVPRGEQGVKGDTGPKGETGPQGATGNGVASIVKTATLGLVDTYTVTFTDATITTFDVTNGLDGQKVDHISKTSGTGAEGTIDVYTVWGNVAETLSLGTFNVYNGQDGTGVINDATITTTTLWSSSKTREEIAKAKPSTAFLMAYSN